MDQTRSVQAGHQQETPKRRRSRQTDPMPEAGAAATRPETPRRPVSTPGYERRPPVTSAYAREESRPEMPVRAARPAPAPQNSRNPRPAAAVSGPQQPVRPVKSPEPPRRRSGTLPGVLATLVLLAGVMLLSFHILPEGSTGTFALMKSAVADTLTSIIGAEQKPIPELLDFTAANNTAEAPAEVVFTLTTGKSVEAVRVVDETDRVLAESADPTTDNAASRIWLLTYMALDEEHGEVRAALGIGDDWTIVDRPLPLEISAPQVEVAALPEPTATPEPASTATPEPTAEPAAPTLQPTGTPEPAAEPTAAPVLPEVSWQTEQPEAEELTAKGSEDTEEAPEEAGDPQEEWEEEDPEADGDDEGTKADEWSDYEGYASSDETENTEPAQVSAEEAGFETLDGFEDYVLPAAVVQPAPTAAPEIIEYVEAEEFGESVDADESEDTEGSDDDEFAPAEDEGPVFEEETSADEEPSMDEEPAPVQAPAEVPEQTNALPASSGTRVIERPALTAAADSSTLPENVKLTETVYANTDKKPDYHRNLDSIVNMPAGGDYTSVKTDDGYTRVELGVLTFRGDSFRHNAAFGTVPSVSGLSTAWRVSLGSLASQKGTFYGVGYGTQPVIMKWSREVRTATNINEAKKDKAALKEVIIPCADGKIRFLDLADGEETRSPIDLGLPMLCTASIHPSGYPLMVVGQNYRKMKTGTKKIGYRIYGLLDQNQLNFTDGMDGKLKRPYNDVGAFNTSALIDPRSDTMLIAGSNGLLYATELNTEFDWNVGAVSINPSTIVLKSKTAKEKSTRTGVEASMAAYQNYVWYGDATGVIRCVDTTTMRSVWVAKTNGDEIAAALALDFDEQDNLNLYVADTLYYRASGDCLVTCYDAMSGRVKWTYTYGTTRDDSKLKFVSGAKASPVIGENDISDLVIYTVSGLRKTHNVANIEPNAPGAVIALRKSDGSLAWSYQLDAYSYSSPVAVYTEDGTSYIVQASSTGKLTLLQGTTGKVITTMQLDGTVDGSPAVYRDMLVIGTGSKNGSYLYGIRIEP